jgi:hypothetical protein
MQDIGDHQFLMLLLVIEPDLDDRNDFLKRFFIRTRDKLRNRRIDMRAIETTSSASGA